MTSCNSEQDAEKLTLDNQVCFPLYSAANAVIRAYRPFLQQLDLTYSQYLVMMVLWQTNGINVKTLGEKLYLDSGTLTPLLKRLESKSLVERKRSLEDERVRMLYLTEKGAQLKEQAMAIPEGMFCKIGLPLDDLIQLKTLCEKVLSRLD
ncbi:MarR family transcriptional regulator [Vibrio sp. MACH09]|uniref:MarR family winged helix-turn-helix transcriptional regulator n=1 Tax=Vibrio sp. MACH09 TaxID=3025122 RepID=UPI0027929C65|nr:MarR family transcriptional regulator [Vibrio sp. MACH09]GLO62785.1 MarR family transcriptional regulator [Vibrio sp. MACH09]